MTIMFAVWIMNLIYGVIVASITKFLPLLLFVVCGLLFGGGLYSEYD